ncbi:MAG TPA: SAM-dependent methyltransferase [Alteromonas sp.]|nr:SAM-dependent methyltransferase [Alteromonas sp.]|tara:strand:- start:266 stop:1027 length:762 start_codon:yes stop_codon:yes gene_type:complete
MKSAFHPKPLRYPQSWSELPGGDELKQAIEGVCDDLSQRVFGYNLVKLGNLSSEIKLPGCAIRNQVVQTQVATEASSLISNSDKLPYIENSIDGFLLANELDFARDPHEILREVDRTITANGYVIISGFNPYSLTGLARFLPIKKGNILHQARFFSAGRIKDWLQLLGFEIVEHRHILFSMLFASHHKGQPAAWQQWCSRYCPWCSSVYVLMARKRAIPMTTIKPKWKVKPRFSAVGASMRDAASRVTHSSNR